MDDNTLDMAVEEEEIPEERASRAGWLTKRQNLIGFLLCLALFSVGFVIHGTLSLYFNLSGFLIVVSGTLGATFISFNAERLKIVYKVLWSCYRNRVKDPDEIIELLLDLSVKSKLQGMLSLQEDEEETTIMFLRQALSFIVDGYPTEQIRDLLNTEIYFFKLRREETERVLRTMAETAPAFGLVGAVVGLISMMAGIGNSEVILGTIPIALTSVLYGIVLANFFLHPFAVYIRERTAQEIFIQKIIAEGAIAIRSDLHPRMLEMKLKSFLTPSSRRKEPLSIRNIQEKLKEKAFKARMKRKAGAEPVTEEQE